MTEVMDVETRIAQADSDFPALFQLFGGYFHEDWRVEHENPAAALSAFTDEAPPEAVREAARELDALLELPLADDELGALLRRGFDCNYIPSNDGLSARSWLVAVRQRVQPGG
jgi:hypothetical protein